MALLRDVEADDRWHAIPLYRGAPVVVAPRRSLVDEFIGIVRGRTANSSR